MLPFFQDQIPDRSDSTGSRAVCPLSVPAVSSPVRDQLPRPVPSPAAVPADTSLPWNRLLPPVPETPPPGRIPRHHSGHGQSAGISGSVPVSVPASFPSRLSTDAASGPPDPGPLLFPVPPVHRGSPAGCVLLPLPAPAASAPAPAASSPSDFRPLPARMPPVQGPAQYPYRRRTTFPGNTAPGCCPGPLRASSTGMPPLDLSHFRACRSPDRRRVCSWPPDGTAWPLPPAPGAPAGNRSHPHIPLPCS